MIHINVSMQVVYVHVNDANEKESIHSYTGKIVHTQPLVQKYTNWIYESKNGKTISMKI